LYNHLNIADFFFWDDDIYIYTHIYIYAVDWTQSIPQPAGESGFWYSGGQGVGGVTNRHKHQREY
jgi:hypothetical protein